MKINKKTTSELRFYWWQVNLFVTFFAIFQTLVIVLALITDTARAFPIIYISFAIFFVFFGPFIVYYLYRIYRYHQHKEAYVFFDVKIIEFESGIYHASLKIPYQGEDKNTILRTRFVYGSGFRFINDLQDYINKVCKVGYNLKTQEVIVFIN